MSDNVIDIKNKQPIITNIKGYGFDDLTNDQEDGGGPWDSEISAYIEAQTLKGLFSSDDWVFIVLDLVADYLSRSPMVVNEINQTANGREEVTILKQHPVLSILERPNPSQGYHEFIYNYLVEQDLMGNTILYWGKVGKNLYIIPAESVFLDFDDKGRHSGYIVNKVDSAEYHDGLSDKMLFKKNTIWHQMRPNPQSLLWGLSPFIPNRRNVLINRYSSEWLISFYQKGTMPTIALTMDNATNEVQAKKFLRTFEMAHGGGRRSMRRPIVLPKGVSVDNLTPPMADAQLPELIKMNRENILNILRVPKHAVSLAETGSLGSEEHKQALKFFYDAAIIPKQNRIAKFLTRNFRNNGLLLENQSLAFDNTEVQILREDMLEKSKLAKNLAGIWTLNEIRESLWAMEPKEGGDTLNIGVSANRLQGFSEPKGSQEAPVEDDEDEDIPIKAQKKEITTKDDGEYEDDLQPQAKEYREQVVDLMVGKYSEYLKIVAKGNLDFVEQVDKKVEKFLDKLFKQWAEQAMKIIEKELRKAEPRKKALDDDDVPKKIPSKRRMRKLIDNALQDSDSDFLSFYNDSLTTIIEDAYDVQINIIPDGENREAIAALKEENEKGRKRSLEVRGIESFANIKDTQTNAIMKVVERGIEDKKTLIDIGKEIEDRFEKISKPRAQLIARQEALTASSLGKQAALKDTVKIIPDMVKVWINLGDLRVRGNPGGLYPDTTADHWVLQGETKEIDEPFSNDLMYPRDVKGPANEVIGCRCDFLMVPREDLESLDV